MAHQAITVASRETDSDGPEDAARLGEARTLLESTVQGLPLKQRLAFVMRKIHDLDYDAIGRSLDCSGESARAHVFQALRKIRTSLNGHELPPAGGVEKRASPASATASRGAEPPPSESPLSMEPPR